MKRLHHLYINAYRGLSQESWMLAAVMLLNRAGSMVLPFLGVYMVDHLGFTLAESGLVLSFFGLGAVVGSFLGGYITDKIGEFKVQVFSLFTSVPLFCLFPLFTSIPSLAAMIFVQSVVSEVFRPANSVAITRYAKPEMITRSFSLNRMAVNLGFSVGPAVGGVLAAISYNFLFFTNAAAALVAGLAYLFFFNKRHKLFRLRQRAAKTDQTASIPTENSPYRDIAFVVFCLLCALFSICFFQLLNTLPLFYKEALQLKQSTIGLLLAYSGFLVVMMEMLLVNIAERKLSITQTMLVGCILCALSYGMLGFNPGIAALFISITLLSCGEILVLPFMSTITAMSSGTHNKGAYMGMNGISVAVAFIISPLLGSQVATAYGFNTLWLGTAALLFLACLGFYFSIPYLLRNRHTFK